ncbi:hypothetical protein HDU85_001981 [Gaertneriomyces sp. JEL0708]|nr:hypothetical protein HDU85_001981 [Gaertneriomyces sp. JEL0708]
MYHEIVLNTATLASENSSFNIAPAVQCYAIKLISVSLLQTWDAVDARNNAIAFSLNGESAVRTAKITPGNYNAINITDALASAMTAVSGGVAFTVTYDDITRRLTISAPTAFKVLPGNRGTTAFNILGISKTADSGFATSHTFTNQVNLSASAPVLLTSRSVQLNRGIVYPNGSEGSEQNILACIPLDNHGDVIVYNNPSDKFFQVQMTLSSIDLQLVDSLSMQKIKTSTPMVVTFGVYDDPADLLNV